MALRPPLLAHPKPLPPLLPLVPALALPAAAGAQHQAAGGVARPAEPGLLPPPPAAALLPAADAAAPEADWGVTLGDHAYYGINHVESASCVIQQAMQG